MANTSLMKNHVPPCLMLLSKQDAVSINNYSTRLVMQALV